VETPLRLRPNSFQYDALVRSALCDSSVTEARDLRQRLFCGAFTAAAYRRLENGGYDEAAPARARASFTAAANSSTTMSISSASLYRPSPKRSAV